MIVGIDVSPLEGKHALSHRVRGTGFYLEYIKKSLQEYFPENKYVFFTRREKIPENIDLIHIPYFEPFFFTLPILKQVPTVVTVHDLTPLVFPDFFPAGLKGSIRWRIQRVLLQQVDAIIADSDSSRNDVKEIARINKDKIHTVHLAASESFKNIPKFQNEYIKEKYKLPEKFALYVGDVTWNKNLPRLIEAIKRTDIHLVLAGKTVTEKNYDASNPWNQDLVKVQHLIKDSRQFTCTGFVTTEELVALYNNATIFTMPSLYEGFGLPILEAMSCGCPVVTSEKGSLKEVAGDAAYFIDPYKVENIVSGIIKVFENEKLREDLLLKGFNQAKKFTWKKTALQTIDVYKKILKKQKIS